MKNFFLRLAFISVALALPAKAQEVSTIKPGDLKETPQRYWASFFVFSDVLVDPPENRSTKVDDDKVYRFSTDALGDAYAESAVAEVLREAEPGIEFLFFATVKQQKSGLWGRGGDFVVIVKEASVVERDAEAISSLMAEAQAADATNRAAIALRNLGEVSQAVQQELYGFAQSEGMTVEELIAAPEYQQKVAGSIRTALRRYEQQNRSSSQELFVDVIRSLLAPTKQVTEPESLEVDIYIPDDMVAFEDVDSDADQELIEALKKAQATLQTEIEARAEAEARVAELEMRLEAWPDELDDQLTAAQNDTMALALDEAKAELQKEVEARAAAEARITDFLAEIEELKNELTFTKQQLANEKPDLAGILVSLELAEAKLEEVTSERNQAADKTKDLQAKVEELTGQVETLKSELANVAADAESRIAEAWAAARDELEKEATARAKTEARLEELQAKMDELNVEATVALSEELSEELARTREELDEVTEDYQVARNESVNLAAELEVLRNKAIAGEQLTAALDDARSRIALETEARNLAEQRMTEFGEEIQRLQQLIANREVALREATRLKAPALRVDAPRMIRARD
jgi:chromosome segregation ATPase